MFCLLSPWRLPEQYGARSYLIAASRGIRCSPGHAALGDATCIASTHPHGHQNGLGQSYNCLLPPPSSLCIIIAKDHAIVAGEALARGTKAFDNIVKKLRSRDTELRKVKKQLKNSQRKLRDTNTKKSEALKALADVKEDLKNAETEKESGGQQRGMSRQKKGNSLDDYAQKKRIDVEAFGGKKEIERSNRAETERQKKEIKSVKCHEPLTRACFRSTIQCALLYHFVLIV